MISLEFIEFDFEVRRALNVCENHRVHVHCLLVAMDGECIRRRHDDQLLEEGGCKLTTNQMWGVLVKLDVIGKT